MNKSHLIYSVLTILALSLFTLSCTKDKVVVKPITPTISDTISFNKFVLPLMNTNCATSGCHDANSATQGYVFDSYENIKKNAVAANNAMNAINGFQQMPLGQKLDQTSIDKFKAWMDQGLKNN